MLNDCVSIHWSLILFAVLKDAKSISAGYRRTYMYYLTVRSPMTIQSFTIF